MERRDLQRMDPLSDSVFSCLFGDESTVISMLEIINAVMKDAGDPPIKAITRMDSQYSVMAERVGARSGRLDIRAVAEDGTLFDIEVQLSNQHFMNDRSWFYGSRLMSDAFGEGENYWEMPRVRVINLLDFVLRPSHPDYLQPIGVMYKKEPMEVATDVFRIYNIELPKFRASYSTLDSAKGNELTSWLYLLDEGYKNEQEMEVLTNMTEGMRAFAKKYNRSLDDPKLKALYELDLSARRDQAAVAYSARQEGREEGSKNEKVKIIGQMLSAGLPVEVIYKCIDASQSEIDAIIASVQKN
jgi:predicted transposase/invertase (TIGR01784 family)